MRQAPTRPCSHSPSAANSTTGVPFPFPVCGWWEMTDPAASGEQLRRNPAWCGRFPTAGGRSIASGFQRSVAPSKPRRSAQWRNTLRDRRVCTVDRSIAASRLSASSRTVMDRHGPGSDITLLESWPRSVSTSRRKPADGIDIQAREHQPFLRSRMAAIRYTGATACGFRAIRSLVSAHTTSQAASRRCRGDESSPTPGSSSDRSTRTWLSA